MINKSKWLESLPKNNLYNVEIDQLDHDRWVNTIPKSNTYNSIKKYSFAAILFVCGLILVSAIKNETRNLQKEINNLQASVRVLKFNLNQTILDNEVLTSPENISKLAKEYLNTEFTYYKKSQIRKLGDNSDIVSQNNIENKNLSNKIKSNIAKKINKKKKEIAKLQKLYSNPKEIPAEIKTEVAKKIKEKKIELKNIYNSPKEIFTLERAQRWGVIQVAKLFFGIPIVPGK